MHKTGDYTIMDLAKLFRISAPHLVSAEHVAAQGN
jgi:hypothetical protein